jgi:aspartyl/asparaginyl beta-hydroxylase (cupin superfamily)
MNSAAESRQFFERLVAGGQGDASAYLGLANACASMQDHRAALAAAEHALLAQPRNLRALIVKADQLAALGDARTAASFYRAAVNAAPAPQEMPAELRDEVARASVLCARYADAFETNLRRQLATRNLEEAGSRFSESLELLTGRKKVYFQEPRHYFFPGLPQIQFYPRAAFPWLDSLEAASADIRAELLEIMKQDSAFRPYLERNARLPHTDAHGLFENPAWSAFYLWKHGELVRENAARCPKTVAALRDVPFADVTNRSPSVIFSLLLPGAHIPPHTGELNTRLVCHLPLVVPDNCHLRVGNDTRQVVEGKAWLFDDTIEHEAWNGSDRTRVILLFEVWRPELAERERAQVRAMFEAIDAYGAASPLG